MSYQPPGVTLPLDEEEKVHMQVRPGDWNNLDYDVLESEKTRYVQIAKHTRTRKKVVSIRLQESVLDALKMQAEEEGIPYHTLIGSVLYRHTKNREKVSQSH